MTIKGVEHGSLIIDNTSPITDAQLMYDAAYSSAATARPSWGKPLYDTLDRLRPTEPLDIRLPHISLSDVYGVGLAVGSFASSAVLAGYTAVEGAAYAGSSLAHWFDENEFAQSLEKMMQQTVQPLEWALGAFTLFGLAGIQHIRHSSASSRRRTV